MQGIVLRSTGSRYDVSTSEGVLSCTIRGKFRLSGEDATNPIVIGDNVVLEKVDQHTSVIVERLGRSNKLSRRAAGRRVGKEHVLIANVDTAWVIQSIRRPRINPGFIDRFLVMTEAAGIHAGIVFNKIDLLDEAAEEVIEFFAGLYASLGYEVVFSSTKQEDGMLDLESHVSAGVHVVVGPSGVGKTSILNALLPHADLKTGAISEATQKGKHTTTYAELIPTQSGGFVGDTPGLREFGLFSVDPAELSHLFPEYRSRLGKCRFPNCTHDHEPGCHIKELVDERELSIERYESYINMLSAARLGDQDVGR